MIPFIIILVLGITLITQFIYHYIQKKSHQVQCQAYEKQYAQINTQLSSIQLSHEKLQEKHESYQLRMGELQEKEIQLERLRQENTQLSKEHKELEGIYHQIKQEFTEEQTTRKITDQQYKEKLTLLESQNMKFQDSIKLLSREILIEGSLHIHQEQEKQLHILLDPLKEKIKEFEASVQTIYSQESRERFALGKQVERLATTGDKLDERTNKLTKAFTHNQKIQGIWGEMVLHRVLEQAGLREGLEYSEQTSFTQEDGKRLQPDIILHLPDNRHIIIDSKVSLVSFTRYVEENQGEEERKEHLKKHIDSIKNHIRNLRDKSYHTIEQLHTLDLVLLFIPIEAAYVTILQEQPYLLQETCDKNILIVSPATLMNTLRIISHIWRQEAQKNHINEIIKQSTQLLEDFTSFLTHMEDIDRKLKTATKSYDFAYKKLYSGKKSLVKQADSLKNYGILSSKKLEGFLQNLNEEETSFKPLAIENTLEEEIDPA